MTRKTLVLLIIVLHVYLLGAQNKEISIENYYNHYTTGESLTTNWLRRNEIVPIIIEELQRYGFEDNFEYKLYKLKNEQFIVLDVYNEKDNFGFVYKTGHSSIPKSEHRENHIQYTITYNDVTGKSSGRIDVILPKNIYLLDENWYWYQYQSEKNETNNFINRTTIIKILRNDINIILANYKDLQQALEDSKWKAVLPNPEFAGFIFVDSWAKFIHGQKGIDNYILNSTSYPEEAYKKKIEGIILVEFEVTKSGKIGNVNVIQGGNELLEQEAIRVIENMPNWKPAIQKGKPISLKYVQQFNFKL